MNFFLIKYMNDFYNQSVNPLRKRPPRWILNPSYPQGRVARAIPRTFPKLQQSTRINPYLQWPPGWILNSSNHQGRVPNSDDPSGRVQNLQRHSRTCPKLQRSTRINPYLQWPPGCVLNSSDPQGFLPNPQRPLRLILNCSDSQDVLKTPATLKDVYQTPSDP